MENKNDSISYLYAITLIIGTIVGAGILGLPYIFAKAGFLAGILNLVIVGSAATLMSLYVGEVSLRTKEKHQLAGLAEVYLGKKWKIFMTIFEIFGTYTAVIAYLIGIGWALRDIFGFGDPLIFSSIFFVIASPLVYLGIRRLGQSELLITFSKLTLVIIICTLLLPYINTNNLNQINPSKILLPFGLVLFASLGYSVIPEVKEILKNNQQKIFSAILIASIVSLSIYFIFTYTFVGVFGSRIEEIATKSMIEYKKLGDIFILLTMITPYLALSKVVEDVYINDWKLDKRLSWFITAFIPFIIFVFSNLDFVNLLSISGTYAGGMMGLLTGFITLKARKSKTKPVYIVPGGNFLIYLTMAVFVSGMLFYSLILFNIL